MAYVAAAAGTRDACTHLTSWGQSFTESVAPAAGRPARSRPGQVSCSYQETRTPARRLGLFPYPWKVIEVSDLEISGENRCIPWKFRDATGPSGSTNSVVRMRGGRSRWTYWRLFSARSPNSGN